MWNPQRIYEIVIDSVGQYRKGPEVTVSYKDNVNVTEFYLMPHESEIEDSDTHKIIDVQFFTALVDIEKANHYKKELKLLLSEYPDLSELKSGPSYIHVGGTVGDQGIALMLFALGSVLEFWEVITPKTFGFEGADAHELAGSGLVMITGFKDD